MPKFSSDLAEAVRVNLKDLLRFTAGATGKILWVKASASTGYHEFKKQHPDYEDGTLAVYTTITAGIAALNDYDVLMITPGNYDEADTITLTGKKGVKIIGANTGMQWGEGSTNWRSTVSGKDLFNLTGNQGLEIANIGFVVEDDGKDAINFTGLNYSVHIHDCCFTGEVGGSAVMAYAINAAGANGPDLYVHDCKFYNVKTTAIVMGHQRNVITNNVFIVAAGGKGITLSGTATKGYALIADNYFVGPVDATTYGIHDTTAGTIANYLIVNNLFSGFTANKQIFVAGTGGDTNCLNNFKNHATNGSSLAVDPSL